MVTSKEEARPAVVDAVPLYQDLKFFTGNAHPALANAICDYLEMPLGECEVFEFSNENIFVHFEENVRARDLFLVQTMTPPVNTRLMELFIMIDAAKRASAGRIPAVVPYYAYGRSDKKDQPRVPITARLIANFLEAAGADRMLTIDLHAGQIQGFFNIQTDELTALSILADYFKKQRDNRVVVAPDLGAAKRARNFAQMLNAPLAVMEKRRLGNDEHAEIMHVIGEVKGMRALVVDDEIDTAGTLVETMKALLEAGVSEVTACATHAVLSGPAVQRIEEAAIGELVVTDTLPLPPE